MVGSPRRRRARRAEPPSLLDTSAQREVGATQSVFVSPSRWAALQRHRGWTTAWGSVGGSPLLSKSTDDAPARLSVSCAALRDRSSSLEASEVAELGHQRRLIADALDGAGGSPHVWRTVAASGGSSSRASPRPSAQLGRGSPLSSLAMNRLKNVAADEVRERLAVSKSARDGGNAGDRWPELGPSDHIQVLFRVQSPARAPEKVDPVLLPLPHHPDPYVNSNLVLEQLRRQRLWESGEGRRGAAAARRASPDRAVPLRPATHPLPFRTTVNYHGFDIRTGRPETMVRWLWCGSTSAHRPAPGNQRRPAATTSCIPACVRACRETAPCRHHEGLFRSMCIGA
jgi:hypothetical protein